jgi:glycerophosphoryl diester phosphodiesterase
MLVAHRGGSKLAPENTIAAFQRAIDWWAADMLELDVRLTKDGQVVVIHDADVARTTDGQGLVSDFTLDQLQALDAGFHFRSPDGDRSFAGTGVVVPTLGEVLAAFPATRINVEAKEPQVARPMVDVIREHDAESRTLLAAEFERSRAGVRDYAGPWGASRHHILSFWISHRLPGGGPYTPSADILQVPEAWQGLRIVSPRFIRAAQARNIPVHVWTVDDPDDMKRLVEWGVDGIQSDRPDLLAKVLTETVGRTAAPGSVPA